MSAVPERRRGLGRGLEVLVGGVAQTELAHLPVETIHPNPRQPRKRFESESTHALADSIRAQGVIQPVLVRPLTGGGYELIAGERRWRAAREAGEETVPALVRARLEAADEHLEAAAEAAAGVGLIRRARQAPSPPSSRHLRRLTGGRRQ